VKEANLFPGKNTFPFDPTKGPGYVWHCHILDHEDNDMMRPMAIVNNAQPCLNCESGLLNSQPGTTEAGNATPATTKPAHNHHGYDQPTPAVEQQNKGTNGSTPMPMPMPMQP
jgi:hypothetical protein